MGIDRPEQAVRPVRPGTAHLQWQQFPRWAGQLLPRHPGQDSGGHRRGRGIGVDGHAGPLLAGRPSRRHGGVLLAGRLQAHQRVERGDRLLGSPQVDRRARQHRAGSGRRGQVGDGDQPDSAGVGRTAERKRAAGGRLSGRHQDHDSAEPRSAGGVCRLADSAGEPLVCESHRQPHLGVGDGTRHHPRAGRHSGRQPAQQPRTPGLLGEGAGLQRLRSEASEAADLHLDHVPVLFDTEVQRAGSESQLRQLPVAASGGRGVDRCAERHHRQFGPLHQRCSGAFHVYSQGHVCGGAGRRQHHQFLPDVVRTFRAGHGDGKRARQRACLAPVAAHAEFGHNPEQASERPEARGDALLRRQVRMKSPRDFT